MAFFRRYNKFVPLFIVALNIVSLVGCAFKVNSGYDIFKETYDVDAAIQTDSDLLNDKNLTNYAKLTLNANLSSWYYLKGDWGKCEKYAQSALEMRYSDGALYNGQNPGIILAYDQLAGCYLKKGKINDASEQWFQAKASLSMLENMPGPAKEEIKKEIISNNYIVHGMILFEKDEYNSAKKEFENAVRIKPESIPEGYSDAKGLASKGYDYGAFAILEQLILLDSNYMEIIKNNNLFEDIVNSPDFVKFEQKFNKFIGKKSKGYENAISTGISKPSREEKADFELSKRKLKPNLVVLDYVIDDKSTDGAIGNGNGVPENGETITLKVHLMNKGLGKASFDTKYVLAAETIPVKITESIHKIGRLAPGESVYKQWLVSIPRTYLGGVVKLKLAVTDGEELELGGGIVSLKVKDIQPSLSCSCTFYDKQKRTISEHLDNHLENGEVGMLVVTIKNQGQLAALDLRVEIESDLHFQKKSVKVDGISPEKEVTLEFDFQVPRAIGVGLADVKVAVSQRDFAGIETKVRLPHQPFTP